jgi:hypothetical protein
LQRNTMKRSNTKKRTRDISIPKVSILTVVCRIGVGFLNTQNLFPQGLSAKPNRHFINLKLTRSLALGIIARI